MASDYSREQCKIVVIKILQSLGYQTANTSPLDVLTDLLQDCLKRIGKVTHEYANQFGFTDPNLDHLGLAFRDLNVLIPELEDYVKNVNFCPPPEAVPNYPIPRESNLNFLKPGSKEYATRPVHIHEHLPPMYPLLEGKESEADSGISTQSEPEEGFSSENGQVFKKPADVSPVEFKRTRKEEEGSRPTREISSVMMTTSGFLSPAREGRLPESRTPIPAIEPIAPPQPSQPVPSTSAAPPPDTVCLPTKTPSKKVEKKKDKVFKELFKDETKPPKKVAAVSDSTKKQKNSMGAEAKVSNKGKSAAKVNKTLQAARLKTEKLNTTITPIPMSKIEPHFPATIPSSGPTNLVGKLFTEPDKKKVNIFKKISNVKNEKSEGKVLKKIEEPRSRGSSPDLIIDEPDEIVSKMNIPNDITIEPINPTSSFHRSPDKMDFHYDDGSPPGTPSTPKTPELISHSPPIAKEKRKRKDSRRVRKILKQHHSPIHTDIVDVELERPKTPEAQLSIKQDIQHRLPIHPAIPFPFLSNFGGPGLIPPPLQNHLYPFNFNFKNAFPPANPLNLPPTMPNPLPIPSYVPPPKPEEILPKPRPDIINSPPPSTSLTTEDSLFKPDKKIKEHKKEKKDKIKKKNKKDKLKNKAEKKKLKEEKKDKIKKEKREKRKEKENKDEGSPVPKLLLKLGSPSPRPETPETFKKLNIKPIMKKDDPSVVNEEQRKRETSPGLAKISALVTGPPKPKISQGPYVVISDTVEEVIQEEVTPTPAPRNGPGPGRPRIHPLKTKPSPISKPKKRRTSIKKDEDGEEVWICPACGKIDDGSPMIGCDGCDAWYHWVCVGIQVPPDKNENWYCRFCLVRKNEDYQTDKKKKRKKREKKEH